MREGTTSLPAGKSRIVTTRIPGGAATILPPGKAAANQPQVLKTETGAEGVPSAPVHLPDSMIGAAEATPYVCLLLAFVPEHIVRIREVVHLTLQLQFFR